MSRFNNKQLITGIQNGNEDVFVYLAEKYFPLARRMLRMKGLKDSSTPEFFSTVLVKACMEIMHHKFSTSIEFEPFFFNCLQDNIQVEKNKRRKNQLKPDSVFSDQQTAVVAQCVSILDEGARTLVHAYYAERLSFESIAEKFNFSNAVIAQHEVNKAMNVLEGIVKLRLNISLN